MVLIGDTAKQIFERAQLPNEVLGRIWNLADTEQKGHLGMTEFIVAMHLLASYKIGAMRALPQILPAGLYEAATRRGLPRQGTGSRPTSDGTHGSAIPRQFSGSGFHGRVSPASNNRPPQPPSADEWAISPLDKAQFDRVFITVDTSNRGFITGDQAVSFFSNSRLPEDALAQIWDLADINSEGQLSRDEFAVAMYLIRQQRSKTDGREVLPQTLPTHLIPPSMRQKPTAQQQPTAPTFDNAANITAPKSAAEDLFGLDALSSPTLPSPKASVASPPRMQDSPQPIQNQQTSSMFKPFVPSSTFGQTMMTPQQTGSTDTASPQQSRSVPRKQGSAMDDLLGDNDPEVSKKFTQETTELANLSNQVGSLTGQMQEVRNKRASTQDELSQAQTQKRDFEARLAQLRSAYEGEVKAVKAVEEQLRVSRDDTRKLQRDMALIQGTYQDLQNQHTQVASALDMDHRENTALKERIRHTNAEINEMKPQLEKLRSDARQQKGLVAINKKQLATNEGERDKMKGDVDEASKELDEATREVEESKRIALAPSQTRSPELVASPPSTTSMNPFFRQASSASLDKSASSPFAAPGVTSPNHSAFDSFFGPSLGSQTKPSELPPTSFRTESPSQTTSMPSAQDASEQSKSSSEGPDVPTPSASPPPSTYGITPRIAGEPPAPPKSRQITSSALPLRNDLDRSDSRSSSVNVVPPASRMGGSSGFETPTDRPPAFSELPNQETLNQKFGDSLQAETANIPSPKSDAGSGDLMNSAREKPFGLSRDPSQAPRTAAWGDIPGAFPGDATPPVQDGDRELSRDVTSSKDAPSGMVPSNLADPFARTEQNATPTSAKDDFDSAFASLDSKGKGLAKPNDDDSFDGFSAPPQTKPRGEFPPIEELADDDSESESDRGFDDDFTSSAPQRMGHLLQARTSSQGIRENLTPGRPPMMSTDSNASQLPTPGAQASPPTYDQTVAPSADLSKQRSSSNHFPAEFTGLLPSRENPTSPASSPPPVVKSPQVEEKGLGSFGGDLQAENTAPYSAPSPFDGAPESSAAAAKANAEPVDEITKHQTQPPVPAKTALDEFDFGDLTEAKEADEKSDDGFNATRHHEFDDFNPTFDSPAPSRTAVAPQQPSGNLLPANNNNFNDFEPTLAPAAVPPSSARPPASGQSHDWDAIFAGLDTPQNGEVTAPKQAQPNGERPTPARSVTEDSQSDDPILKRLTAMGWSRDESLGALEKYDYNIDEVGLNI